MLTYNLENRGNTPLYEYIYSCIKNDILTGVLSSDEKLPSKRGLAENLAVSLITVENAYEQLIYEGYIYAIEKKGYYVSKLEITEFGDHNANIMNQITSIALDKPLTTKSADSSILADFQTNHPDKNIFPFSTWAKIMRKTLLDNETKLLTKSDNQGSLELRTAIAHYLRAYKGMSVDPENIVIGAGTEYLYGLILHLLGRNKMIAIEDPCHTKVSKIYESNGVKVLHIPLDKHGFNPDKLGTSNISCIHISPSHQFPTGIVMPAARRHRLIEQAKKQNFYIIEDDYDSELRYAGKPLQAMAALAKDTVIYMNTFTKTLMNSVRIAYMVLPDELLTAYQKKLGFYSCTVSVMEQLTLSAFINEGYYERHINRTRLHYKKCRNNFINCFNNSNLAKKFSIIENDAGLHFIIKCKKAIDDYSYISKLKNKGILLTALTDYTNRPDEQYNHHFLINYFAISEEKLINIFNLMAKSFK